jgi:hypothetical protein
LLIVVILRRLGRRRGFNERYWLGDPTQDPDYRRWQ